MRPSAIPLLRTNLQIEKHIPSDRLIERSLKLRTRLLADAKPHSENPVYQALARFGKSSVCPRSAVSIFVSVLRPFGHIALLTPAESIASHSASVSVAEEKSRDDASGGKPATLETAWGAADLHSVSLRPKSGDTRLFEPILLR